MKDQNLDILREKTEEFMKIYPSIQSVIMPLLSIAEEELGWISPEVLEAISIHTDIPKATIKGVATFYSMYNKTPCGRHFIQLCTNVSCMVSGVEVLVDFFQEKYGLEPGGITEDGRFSLVFMECIGSCGTAPAMLVNNDFYDNLTKESIEEILINYT